MPIDWNVKGKVIAITGAASGIGLATTQLLASQGAIISKADISETAPTTAAEPITAAGGTVMTYAVDVRKEEQVDAWIAATVAKFGKLHGAVNLAGVTPKCITIEAVAQHNTPDWTFTIDVNLTGVFFCMRAQLRQLRDGGSIVNASSVAGLQGYARNAAYTASKHAVIGLGRSAAKEEGHRGVRVNAICPGVIDTAMHRATEEKRGREIEFACAIKRRGEPEEAANLIAWLLCDGGKYISGRVHNIDGAWIC